MIIIVKKFAGIIIGAILTEGIVTYINCFIVGNGLCHEMCMSIILGVLIAIGYKLDIFQQFEMESRIPYLGNVITGLIIARGSNVLYDLIEKISQLV